MHRLQRLHLHLAHGRNFSQATASEIGQFLAAPGFAVVGASQERQKFGNKVLRCYMQHGLSAVPVSITQKVIEGLPCVSSLKDLGKEVCDYGVSVITPPKVTLGLLDLAKDLGLTRLWLQPGSESPEVLQRAGELGLGLIHSGPCLLVELGFNPSWEPAQALEEGQAADGALSWRLDEKQVLTLTLSDSRRRNALGRPVLQGLHDVLQNISPRARVVLLEAQGPVFSSGHDFGDFAADLGARAHEETLKLCCEVALLLKKIPPPTIAVVQGLATAAGCQMACACDLVLAADTAAFQLPGAANGGFCHTPAVPVAARAGKQVAAEMAFLAQKVPAVRAERLGLVNQVLPRVKLASEARKLAERIASFDPEQIQKGKQVLNEQASKSTLEERFQVAQPAMLEMFATPASQKMVAKFRR